MAISSKTEGNQHIIGVQGRFDFSTQSEFRQAYESAPASSNFILDFAGSEYIDSSALGMLLLMRDYAGGDSAKIDIIHCRADIKNILEISNFQKLFTIK